MILLKYWCSSNSILWVGLLKYWRRSNSICGWSLASSLLRFMGRVQQFQFQCWNTKPKIPVNKNVNKRLKERENCGCCCFWCYTIQENRDRERERKKRREKDKSIHILHIISLKISLSLCRSCALPYMGPLCVWWSTSTWSKSWYKVKQIFCVLKSWEGQWSGQRQPALAG